MSPSNVLVLFAILFWMPVIILVLGDWGWTDAERYWLMSLFGGLAMGTLVAAFVVQQARK